MADQLQQTQDIMPEEFEYSNDKVEILQQENMKQLEKDQSKETPNESTQQQDNPPPTTPAKKSRTVLHNLVNNLILKPFN